MILMIDNYDSFTYNLVQALRSLGREVKVVKNDEIDVAGIAALLCDYNARGISPDVLAGSVRAMREAGVKVDLGGLDAVDIVGTGGDGRHTFNVSTAAAFVAANI